jgi:uncharacterized protein (DUF2147 family)
MIRALLPAFLLLSTPALARELPLGKWLRGDGNAHVRIEPCGAKLCAVNTFIKDTSGGENVGDKLVMDVKPDKAGKLVGRAYDPKRDSNYSVTISFDESRMKTRGCIIGVLCRSVSWTRLQ